ncbi:MAG: hydrolase, partial [Pseudomonadota bacterium]
DHYITAPLHGYESGKDYYERASTLSDLSRIDTTTHIICSVDDPFFTKRCIPDSPSQLSDKVTVEQVKGAGHVGFISGSVPCFGKDWLRHRLSELITINRSSRPG